LQPNDRARLTAALRDHVAKIAADLRANMHAPGSARVRAEQLHKDERVAEDFEVWTDLLSRRAAVLWVLKSVYVRVLEDRRLLAPGRLLDPEAQQLFERLAPHLGETALLRWIYRDLASPRGGLPELFSPQPAEVALPSDELSRALIAFWRHRDADTGAVWSFAEERFEGELMGDLYQELDPVVKDRFALCQTPDFVRAFILDRTLTPAIETFGADEVRLLDPACGSGHFLIDGLKRLVAAMVATHPDWDRGKIVAHALDRVVGVDLNDYACALARTRLIMTAAELAGVNRLADAARFHPHVYWADGLEQVEREEQRASLQYALFEKTEDKPRASLTRPEVRIALRTVLQPGFQVVVANPPYILEGDDSRKAYHREKLARRQRYLSAYKQYHLSSPFTERCFQLAVKTGFVGLIIDNQFMKRDFGRPLIEQVLANVNLSLVADTSQAHIPFHGTPTVIIVAQNQSGMERDQVRVVMGRRGETGTPLDPAKGRVWSSIATQWSNPGFENEYVSVVELPRKSLAKYPWSLQGGGAGPLKERLSRAAPKHLSDYASDIGRTNVCGEDPVYMLAPDEAKRLHVAEILRPFAIGEVVRDWRIQNSKHVLYPYRTRGGPPISLDHPSVGRYYWRFRTLLRARSVFGKRPEERGDTWFGHLEHYTDRLKTTLSITFAFVATHNHFVLDRGGKLFNRSAPVLKLPADATENDHLALLGLLNSSAACFWMKQVFQPKAGSGIGRGIQPEPWMERYEHDATKIQLFPVVADNRIVIPYAAKLDSIAESRCSRSVRSVLDGDQWTNARSLRSALDRRRAADFADFTLMVGLQEELDWLCYSLYDLDEASDIVPADDVEACLPTWLPWNLALAERDAANRAALARGEEPVDQPTTWFARHGWEPLADLPEGASRGLKKRIKARCMRTATTPALAMIEVANFKRRWDRPDYDGEESEALALWLADRVEQVASTRTNAFTLEQLVANLQDDPRLLAVCEVLTGRKDFNLSQLACVALQDNAIPSHRFHLYKPEGLAKRDVWERVWADQRREDAGENNTPEVPPAYTNGDFLKPEYWRIRGKLDVPKERFIAFTEVPTHEGAEALYGWAGWTPTQRVKAILAIDEGLEDAAVPLADRIGLIDSAWRLLPDVAREDETTAARLKAELQAIVGPSGPSRDVVEEWRERFPQPKIKLARTSRARATQKECDIEESELS
jgi:hypothetical protein